MHISTIIELSGERCAANNTITGNTKMCSKGSEPNSEITFVLVVPNTERGRLTSQWGEAHAASSQDNPQHGRGVLQQHHVGARVSTLHHCIWHRGAISFTITESKISSSWIFTNYFCSKVQVKKICINGRWITRNLVFCMKLFLQFQICNHSIHHPRKEVLKKILICEIQKVQLNWPYS